MATKRHFAFLLTAILQACLMHGQSMPTMNVYYRTTIVQSEHAMGTIFSISVDGREYWITAKHVITGAKHPPFGSIEANSVSLRILSTTHEEEKWIPINFSVIDPGKDIDIVVLAAQGVRTGYSKPSADATSVGAMLGGDCEFLGFPHGKAWRAKMQDGQSVWMPYVKHCTISAMTQYQGILGIFVLDGINNEGFSGGPVILGTGEQQKIMAVISGYYPEPTDVIFSDSTAPTLKSPTKRPGSPSIPRTLKATVNLNSGFIVAYSIQYATDAIRKHPIGPPLPAGK